MHTKVEVKMTDALALPYERKVNCSVRRSVGRYVAVATVVPFLLLCAVIVTLSCNETFNFLNV